MVMLSVLRVRLPPHYYSGVAERTSKEYSVKQYYRGFESKKQAFFLARIKHTKQYCVAY